jgi:hypothetical protein
LAAVDLAVYDALLDGQEVDDGEEQGRQGDPTVRLEIEPFF